MVSSTDPQSISIHMTSFETTKEHDISTNGKTNYTSKTVTPETTDTLSPGTKNLTKLWFALVKVIYCILFVGYSIYLIFAILYEPSGAIFLCVITPFVLVYVANRVSNGIVLNIIHRVLRITRRRLTCQKRTSTIIWRCVTIACCLGLIAFLVVDIWDQLEKWIPLGGLLLFVAILVATSRNRRKINWSTVIWGLLLQFCMGLLILRWGPGFEACRWLGKQVTTLLEYTDDGSKFVFGDNYLLHPVAFKIIPVVVFFSAVVSALYYIGVMQVVIKGIAVCVQFFMRTTPVESFATAAHIFIGQIESSVALKPFLLDLTTSELHALMTSGFATVAGTVIAAYVEFGVPAEHVISASFMSAPAALAVSKIAIPETEVSRIKSQKEISVPVGNESNLLEAVSAGATNSIKLVASLVVNLIAMIALISFLDSTLSYFGGRIGYPEITFQLVLSYIFMPVAVTMGVPWKDCRLVGALIGKKLVINEFLSYADLGTYINEGRLEHRSSVVATYILCGFGSIAALGINLGALSAAAPSRRTEIAQISLRAMINGNIACFMTACVAGLLYQDLGNPTDDLLQSNLTSNFTTVTPGLVSSAITNFTGTPS